MKCYAGVEFPDGKPCPKCKAELGEVCWPGINRDLLELPKLRKALTDARGAIASLPMDALGFASAENGEQIHWPIRDELLHRIDEALLGSVGQQPQETDS